MGDRVMAFIAIALLAMVCASSYWYAQSLRQHDDGRAPQRAAPDYEVENFTLTQFDADGRAKSRLRADTLTHFADSDDVALTEPRLQSLRPDRPRVQARAQRARLENTGQRLWLRGDVSLVRAADGAQPAMRIDTASLLVLPDQDRYMTDDPVTAARGRSTVSSRGVDFDNIARTVDFKADVRMILAAPTQP